jgi:ankyrin repeat protein
MYGYDCDYDRWGNVRKLVKMFFKEPQSSHNSSVAKLLMEANICDQYGNFNENVSSTDWNNALVSFFRLRVEKSLSADVLDHVILEGNPDIDAKDSNGRTAFNYIDEFPSDDRDFWIKWWKNLHGNNSHTQSVGSEKRKITQEEQRRRDRNLALRTAARNGDLNGVINALRQGAQINDHGPKSGLTALDHAEDAGRREVANYLRSQGGRRASGL